MLIGRNQTGHSIVREMHAVDSFINEDRDRGVRAGVGNMLHHFSHDEWVANQEAHDVWGLWAKRSTKDDTLIEVHELHQINWADSAIDQALNFHLVCCGVNARIELGDVWMTNLRGNRADYFRKWFRGRNAKSFDRNFLLAIASSFFI